MLEEKFKIKKDKMRIGKGFKESEISLAKRTRCYQSARCIGFSQCRSCKNQKIPKPDF